jgi:hypothetical protein
MVVVDVASERKVIRYWNLKKGMEERFENTYEYGRKGKKIEQRIKCAFKREFESSTCPFSQYDQHLYHHRSHYYLTCTPNQPLTSARSSCRCCLLW